MSVLLEVKDLRKTYTRGTQIVEALKGITLQIRRGSFVSIMGPSGSGKSTLLHLMGGLDRPSAGNIQFEGQSIEKYSDDELSAFRRRKLGFIFQFFNLLPTLSALENVALPLLLDGVSMKSILPKAQDLLKQMGLGKRMGHRPDQLSGGEMQRVAIARALVTDPLLILADEPTGNLDSKTGDAVLALLAHLVKEHQQTLLMVTHNASAAEFGTRCLRLQDGQVESDLNLSPLKLPEPVLAHQQETPPSCEISSATLAIGT